MDVPGDNNCQFHALVDQLKQLRPQHHTDAFTLRNDCIDWLQANADMYMEVTTVIETEQCVADLVVFVTVGSSEWRQFTPA